MTESWAVLCSISRMTVLDNPKVVPISSRRPLARFISDPCCCSSPSAARACAHRAATTGTHSHEGARQQGRKKEEHPPLPNRRLKNAPLCTVNEEDNVVEPLPPPPLSSAKTKEKITIQRGRFLPGRELHPSRSICHSSSFRAPRQTRACSSRNLYCRLPCNCKKGIEEVM